MTWKDETIDMATADDRRRDVRVPDNMLTLVFDTLRRLEDRMTAHAAEARTGFAGMRDLLDDHTKDDRAVENRVLILEQSKQFDDKQAIKRGAWTTIVVSGLIQILIWAVRKLMGS